MCRISRMQCQNSLEASADRFPEDYRMDKMVQDELGDVTVALLPLTMIARSV